MERDIIWDVRWCPHEGESDIFVSGSADHTARIWKVDTEAHTMSLLWSYTGHDGSVNTVRYHPNKNIICSSSGDRTCHIWKPSLSGSLIEYELPMLAQRSERTTKSFSRIALFSPSPR